MNGEKVRILKVVVITSFKVLFQCLPKELRKLQINMFRMASKMEKIHTIYLTNTSP
jgi:hypothetical protein